MPEELFAKVKTYPGFESGWNRLQTITEIVVAFIVAAGLIGLFGTGPLSSAKAQGPNGDFGISYERILRRTVESKLKISLIKPVTGPTVEVLLPDAFLNDMTIASASPRASAMRLDPRGITYVFDVGPAGTGQITFDLKPKGYGPIASPFVVAGEPIVLHQFIFP